MERDKSNLKQSLEEAEANLSESERLHEIAQQRVCELL